MLHDGGGDLFRVMFERSADAILLLDTVSNVFVEYNEAALGMLACSREELAKLHPSRLSPEIQPDGRPSFEKANEMIGTAVARGNHRFEWVHRSPHRADFWVEVLLTPIQVGPAPLILVVWRDITVRREAEHALREAQRRESLGVLAAGIAHDFNNLLSAVSGHVELLRTTVPAGDPGETHVNQIEHAVRRASELSRQMLAYGGHAQPRVETLDVSSALAGVADLLAVSVPKLVRLTRNLAPNLPGVRADAAQLQQIALNLVTNAGEAIGARSGEIELRTESRELTVEEIAHGFAGQELRPGRYVFLTVTDTGEGIPDAVRARLFDPFFSTKRAGRGLGLSAILGILRTHGGGYHIDSTPGVGTRFTVCFPADAGPAPVPQTAASPRMARHELRGTVLLVDDEEVVRSATRGILEFLGAHVIEATDGAEAIETFTAQHAQIDWVLMDLTMPRMDGHAAFLALRAVDPNVRVVLASGWSASDLTPRFAETPPAAFLDKPFRARELVAVARQIGVAG